MSSQFKDIMKNGWHPEKSGTGIRGSVSGLMGRNKDKEDSSSNHVARPLTDLTDPASFAPPPRRTGSGLAPAPSPVSTKRKVVPAPSTYADPRAGHVEPPPRNTGTEKQDDAADPTRKERGVEQSRMYRSNTTGLSTNSLPRPPGRRDGADGRSPPSYAAATSGAAASNSLPPSLPPRLPPRGAAATSEKNGGLGEGAMNRLGAAGISVPSLGIGHGSAANSASPSPPPPSGAGRWGAQVEDELQNRFSKTATPSAQEAQQSNKGTTWAQKQAALKTASSFQKDPSSVSLSDAKAAVGTANNFRQRHGQQVAAGAKAASSFNQKYRIADKLGAYTGSQATPTTQHESSPPPLPGPCAGVADDMAQTTVPGLAGKKKPPPPPPKKKPGLAAAAAAAVNPPPASRGEDAPPPVPLSTRPQF
ncbi:hypothetical protein ED733_004092 [Metarhizium rileyi]|uniref:GMP synthase n=1 Tax=Metarhizium rileyi (strain RCEF 4871) TaxID=1649241 RepID=A0A5C6GAJ3_METRR|nr:hypothetical protein ED733_004092 [Metarhizium rileyi]